MKTLDGTIGALLAAVALMCIPTTRAGGWETELPQPEMRQSSDGVLSTVLRATIAANQIDDQLSGERQVVHTPTYNGTIPGPTLVLSPGDTLAINFINSFPDVPTTQRGGGFPHGFSSLNLHTHGLQVSPSGISDNIFRVMAPGTQNRIKVEIPPIIRAGRIGITHMSTLR